MHRVQVARGNECKLRLTIDDGSHRRRINLFVRRGENLLDALRRLEGLQIREHPVYGPEIVDVAGVPRPEGSGWHFFINGQIPFVQVSGQNLYVSPYHLNVDSGMNIQLALVSNCADFENSVLEPMLGFTTSVFFLERVGREVATQLFLEKMPGQFELIQKRRIIELSVQSGAERPSIRGLYVRKVLEPELPDYLPDFQKAAPQLPNGAESALQFQSILPALEVLPEGPMMQLPTIPALFAGAKEEINQPGERGSWLKEGGSKSGAEGKEECEPKKGGSDGGGGKKSSHSGEEEGPKSRGAKKPAAAPIPLSSLSSLKAVIFDLDGVVVQNERAHLATFNQLPAPLGIRVDEREWKRNYTRIGSYAIMEDISRKDGMHEPVGKYVQKRAHIYQEYVERHGLAAMPGFMEFHSGLLRAGVQTAIASGGHKPHILASMMAIGVPRMAFFGLEDVRRRKPDPKIFLLAAKRLGIQPSECIVFEDSLSGLQAAASAGMAAVALKGKAALVIRNFRTPALRKALSRLLKRK